MTGGATLNIGGTLVNLDNLCIANYSCDFGNVVVGATKKRSFRFTNVGKLAINFAFDKKILGNYGISIEPDKVQKLAPNQTVLFNVVYATRKNAKFGKVKSIVPIDLKYGPSYAIEFVANLTIPELTMSTGELDFQKVCVNTRKMIKVRLENHKEVPCDWQYFFKADVSASKEGKEAGERFQVFPVSGTLQPGQKQTVDVMFTPNVDKPFVQKINFKVKDNPKIFMINAKGQGVNYQVDFVPDTVKLGPVLPYSNAAMACIEMRNPMDIPIEVYSLDFDKLYIEEEEILKRLEQFQLPAPQNPPATPATAPPPIDPLFLSLRMPGMQFWTQLRQ
jgi:hydrocephalus-inducing protein